MAISHQWLFSDVSPHQWLFIGIVHFALRDRGNNQLCSESSAAVSVWGMHASRSHILEDSCPVATTEFGCPALIVATAVLVKCF